MQTQAHTPNMSGCMYTAAICCFTILTWRQVRWNGPSAWNHCARLRTGSEFGLSKQTVSRFEWVRPRIVTDLTHLSAKRLEDLGPDSLGPPLPVVSEIERPTGAVSELASLATLTAGAEFLPFHNTVSGRDDCSDFRA